LVAGRLGKRLKQYGLGSYGEYFSLIRKQTEATELQMALNLLTANENYFFREPKHFDYLRLYVLPKATPGKHFAFGARQVQQVKSHTPLP